MTVVNAENFLPPPVPVPSVQLRSRAILTSTDVQQLTTIREEDPRNALALGLKQYLEGLSINWAGGRELRFVEFKHLWAQPEEPAKYPSAALVGLLPAEYESSLFTPKLEQVDDGTGRFVRFVAELMQEFQLVIWTTDLRERSGLVAMVEDAMEPAEFMTGLRLELPYYFGVRATYEKTDLEYVDDATSAQQRRRRAIFTIKGVVPQIRPVGNLPTMRTQERVTVVDPTAC